MKKVLLFLILSIVYSTLYPPTNADIYIPKGQCPDNYAYFEKNQINPQEYQQTSQPVFTGFDSYNPWGTGYCIDIKEYCSKNKCSTLQVLETINSARFVHLKSILINLFINASLISLFYLLAKTPITNILKNKSILKVFLITVLGYLADLLAFFVAITFTRLQCEGRTQSLYVNTEDNPFCQGLWYKSSLEEQILSHYSLLILSIALPLICALVTFNFYKFYSTNISQDKKRRLLYSVLFGLASNPLWIYVFRLITIL